MAEQHPAVTFLLAAHERALALATEAAEATDGGHWHVGDSQSCECCDEVLSGTALVLVADDRYSGHVAANDPASVVRRVEAEREILAEHAIVHRDIGWLSDGEEQYEELPACGICVPKHSQFRTRAVVSEGPCRTVLGLAKAWGWESET